MIRTTRWLAPVLAAVFAGAMMAVPKPSSAALFVSLGFSIDTPPPPLVAYQQPACEDPGYIWMPGYWALGDYGYYWVPGAWVDPPYAGLYWTPGYWGWDGSQYGWNDGYWATQVGFYGGVDYGFGYYGSGFVGGYWSGNTFRYNTAVVNVNNVYIKNVYVNRTVVRTVTSRVAYNGPGGIRVRPTSAQLAVMHGHRIAMTSVQQQHVRTAAASRTNFASVNRGKPATASVRRPITPAQKPAEYTPPRPADRQPVAQHVKAAPGAHAASAPEYRTERTYNPGGSRPAPASHAGGSRPAPASHSGSGQQHPPQGKKPGKP